MPQPPPPAPPTGPPPGYVDDKHRCHARNCRVPVPPEMLMCKRHWFMVPYPIRQRVWENYRQGQCDDKRPSKEWHSAADEAIRIVAEKEGLVGT